MTNRSVTDSEHLSAVSPATRRLFFALWPDEATREQLAHITRKAVRGSGGRPIPVENLHSTLVFLGSVPEDRFTQVAAAAAQLRHAPIELTFDSLEHWSKPRLLCLACSRPPESAPVLAASLAKLLLGQGLTPDPKPYRPHITIARKVVKPHELGSPHPLVWLVDKIALVDSVTAPEGSRYTVLEQWPLRA
jgi:2'-5' RNA ligase